MTLGAGGSARLSRSMLVWVLVPVLIVLGFIGTATVLNSTLYSAAGFTRAYLDALDRHDVGEALRIDGVELPADTSRALVSPDALGEYSDIRLVSDSALAVAASSGTDLDPAPAREIDRPHRVVFALRIDGQPTRVRFDVARAGSLFGVFTDWRFVASPTSTVDITPVGVTEFDANGAPVRSAGAPNAAERYAVLVPAAVSLSHSSEFLRAEETVVLVADPGVPVAATITPVATPTFIDAVQSELDAVLDACAEQRVLQPTGCPFGRTVRNRIQGEPEWTIEEYPQVTIQPGATPGTWQVPSTEGTAHLVVDVRSLFDGTVTTLDEDVPFSIGYVISFGEDGTVSVTAE